MAKPLSLTTEASDVLWVGVVIIAVLDLQKITGRSQIWRN